MQLHNRTLAHAFALAVPLCTWAQTEIEPNNGSGQATALTYNTAMAGSIGACAPTDNTDDYFSFTPPSQGQLRVQSSMSNSGPTDLEVTFQVRQSSTAVIGTFTLTAGANGVPVNDSFLFPCQGAGLYYISIENPAGGACTNYSFTYDMVAPVFTNDAEPNDGSGSAVTVGVGVWQEGQIDFRYGNNSDYYRIDLPTHGVLNIEWEAEHAGTTSPTTAELVLRQTSTAAVQTWDLPVGANSTPATQSVSIDCRSNSNFYYLSVSTDICGTSYRFRYTVTPPLFANDAEPNDGSGSATVLAHSTPTEGQINFSTYTENNDYYRIDLPTQGILNIQWEAENAGPNGTGTVTATLRQSSTAFITSWDLPVGANSVASSQTVSIDCRSNTGFYYLSLASDICGVSYRFSYTVTPPIFNNDLEPNNGSGQDTAIPHSTPTQGQINFSTYVENVDYYRLDLPTSGILNIHWEGEHASATPGTATLTLRQTSTAFLQSWTVPVGASSIPVSQTVSINCRGNQNFYYLEVNGVSCGISYELSYTVTPAIYAIEPATGFSSGGAAHIRLDSANVQGQLDFFYGQSTNYYRFIHPGGPLVLSMLAEHAGPTVADYTVRLRSSSTSFLQDVTGSAGGNSTPLSTTVDFGVRGNGLYYIELFGTPCGLSYAINCDDADGDGVCNYFDLCAGTPTGEGVNTDGCSCSQVVVDDGDVCTLDECLNGNVTNTFQDADNDLTCDANDGCPNDPNKIAPGQCGCGIADTDSDNDGIANCNDDCPNLAGEQGDPCDDGNAGTGPDTIGANCLCSGPPVGTDCEGVPGGPAVPGTACDDLSACTTNDLYDANCNCVGTPVDPNDNNACTTDSCDPILGVINTPIDPNDGDPCTLDTCDPITGVSNVIQDADGDGTCDANDLCPGGPEPGTACDDGNAGTGPDTIGLNCLCSGPPVGTDCEGVPGGPAVPGTACDDLSACTTNDLYDANCNCVGTPVDPNDNNACTTDSCDPILGVVNTPIDPNDGDPCTLDTCDPITGVSNVFQDADGDGTCDANDLCPGSPEPGQGCDDGNPLTGPDLVDANCNCVGDPIGPCTELLTLDITLDNFGSETTWEVYDETGTTLIDAGGPYADGIGGTTVQETICLNQLCYRLVVNDDGNNGISGGGYVLRDPLGRRIIDADGQFSSTSSNILPFCLPLSANKLINSWCDKTDLVYAYSTQIYASNNPAASGYQFWMADPHGTYSRRVFKTTQNLQPTNLVTLPPPADLDLNVRVRALVNGVYTPFGPACIIRLNTPGGGSGRSTILFDEASAISLSLYPNPNRGEQLFLALGGVQADTKVELDVMDLFGKRVFADRFAAPSEEFTHSMDLNNLASGVYLVNVHVGDRLYTERLVKQ
ncbi:MAG: T9SS type A sorting domain-containing protein [Flavobacteriales bacterium]|nr:T9SS type A sorting domain-containing protein [Flavobacteriales bacterium]